MKKMLGLKPEEVFRYFEEISDIPRGSGNMEKISEYCVNFAKTHCLEYIRDESNNVIIFKKASKGYEGAEPIILQSHLDMVCQKEDGINVDFEKDSIDIYRDGDFVKAKGTTLGADDGIGVAIMLAILSDESIEHPKIEAIFTTDEETGMIGVSALSFENIKGSRMINLDSGQNNLVTVSCAGGSDFRIYVPLEFANAQGTRISFSIKGLKGGHSGIEINNGGINANILMGRILNNLKKTLDFSIISINGGNKGNAIPVACTAEILLNDKNNFDLQFEKTCELIRDEVFERENEICVEFEKISDDKCEVFSKLSTEKIINLLVTLPNGVQEMSANIDGLVETSLNLGVMKTNKDNVELLITLRSNKKTAIKFLEEKLNVFAQIFDVKYESGGYYPPWEFNRNSKLLEIYTKVYKDKTGEAPRIEAIHAGLECGVFSSKISGFDGISVGPDMMDVHTPKERLCISAVESFYGILLKVLSELR